MEDPNVLKLEIEKKTSQAKSKGAPDVEEVQNESLIQRAHLDDALNPFSPTTEQAANFKKSMETL